MLIVPVWCEWGSAATLDKYVGETVSRILFLSEDPISETKLLPLIPLAPGAPLTEEAVRRSLEVLYATRLFHSIEVLAEPGPAGLIITFQVRPNYFFADFQVGGQPVLRSPLRGLSQLPLGEIYSQKKVADILLKVQGSLKNMGYFRAEVTPNIQFVSKMRLAYVKFLIQPGVRAIVGDVKVSGNPVLESQEITGKMKSKPGKLYDYTVLKRDFERIRRVYSDRGFLNASIRLGDLNYSAEQNSVSLNLAVDAGSYVYIQLKGAKIPKKRLRQLVPIYEEGSIDSDLIEEGKKNIEDYFQRSGHFDVAVDSEFIEVPEQNAYQVNYTIKRGERQKVVSVDFPGAEEFSTKELSSRLRTKAGNLIRRGQFSLDMLQEDAATIKDLYLRKGYEQVEVAPDQRRVGKSGSLAVSFRIQEGPQTTVREVKTEGTVQVATIEVLKGLNLAPGRPFSQALMDEDKRVILSRYSARGFNEAKVDTELRRPSRNQVDLTFRVVEDDKVNVSDLYVAGNQRTNRKVIAQNITVHEGYPLSPDSLLISQQKLYGLGIFDKVDILPLDVPPLNSAKPVLVHVEEASPLSVNYGVGYQSWEKFRGTFGITHNNLFGLARALSFQSRDSFQEQRAEITYKEPRLFNRDLDSFLVLYLDNIKRVGFSIFWKNVSFQILKKAHQQDKIFFRYNFETVDLSDVLINPQTVGFPGQNLRTLQLSSLSTAWLRDTRDDPFDPTSGYFNTANLTVTAKPIGSETNFVSFYGQSQASRKIGVAGSVLVSSLRVGLNQPFGSTPEVPISERFFAGGSTTLRGFPQDKAGPLDPKAVDPNTGEPLPLGGNAMIILNIESRIPVSGNVSFAPFYDTGNVFARISTIRLSGFTNNLGFGIRYKTPFGPIRLDFGFNLDRPAGIPSHQIFLTVGNPF